MNAKDCKLIVKKAIGRALSKYSICEIADYVGADERSVRRWIAGLVYPRLDYYFRLCELSEKSDDFSSDDRNNKDHENSWSFSFGQKCLCSFYLS